ncbi:uncharacterized protein LOC121832867 [Ixodes scapularis]|uniref:Secreted protein n=1 Tax=Ixodes scapularis TaxID=6945 RepID=B7P385_IXOSC|nr:uncharacterized protein LOC121832867 [Ixodes scapularis]EEC01057.1 hypothetical protein IscW_ISCW015904 [Ixodes scapularis]|eukprot:XP_002403693.1 hypothetical protein IscW_ISCW015904 [Ixodes scapularis]
MSQFWVLLALASLVAIVGAQEILCPQHRHLNGEINKCKAQLPDLSGKKDKVAALSLRYGLICAREVDPDIAIPDIKERRCRNDDPQDFPRKFYACWNKLLETDELLTKVGFSGEDLEKFKGAIKCANGVLQKTLEPSE